MARETFKDVELGGRKWRLNKLTALDGSNIIRRFMGAGHSNPETFFSSLSDEEFQNIQKRLLMACGEKKDDNDSAPLQVMLPDGRVGVSEISAGVLFMLTVLAFQFNISGFFDERALKDFQGANKDLTISGART